MEIPCKECITLGMCKARLNGGTMMDLMCLSDQCSLLYQFLHPRDKNNKPIGHVSLVDDIETFLCTNIQYNREPF